MAKSAMVGDNFIPMLGVITACMPFHFATLEEYYVGGLWLPVLNGVTDGSVVLIGVNIMIGVMGSQWWADPMTILGFTAPFGHMCFYFVFVVQVVGTIRNSIEIYKAYSKPVANPEHYRETVDVPLLF
jgi:hypothetical protein